MGLARTLADEVEGNQAPVDLLRLLHESEPTLLCQEMPDRTPLSPDTRLRMARAGYRISSVSEQGET
jgi:hypothetical protein